MWLRRRALSSSSHDVYLLINRLYFAAHEGKTFNLKQSSFILRQRLFGEGNMQLLVLLVAYCRRITIHNNCPRSHLIDINVCLYINRRFNCMMVDKVAMV